MIKIFITSDWCVWNTLTCMLPWTLRIYNNVILFTPEQDVCSTSKQLVSHQSTRLVSMNHVVLQGWTYELFLAVLVFTPSFICLCLRLIIRFHVYSAEQTDWLTSIVFRIPVMNHFAVLRFSWVSSAHWNECPNTHANNPHIHPLFLLIYYS
jgi:hypothetical protein